MNQRPSRRREGKKGQICDWPEDVASPEETAAKVRYIGNSQHKSYTSPAGEPALRSSKSKCDHFSPETWPLLLDALQRAIRAKCVGQFRGEFPSKAWAYVNGVLHEAKLDNEMAGSYHGYPLDYEEQHPAPESRLRETAPHVEIPVV